MLSKRSDVLDCTGSAGGGWVSYNFLSFAENLSRLLGLGKLGLLTPVLEFLIPYYLAFKDLCLSLARSIASCFKAIISFFFCINLFSTEASLYYFIRFS